MDSLAQAATQRMPDNSIGNRQLFDERLATIAPNISQERKDQLWLLLNQALTPLYDTGCNRAYAAGRNDEGRAYQEYSRGTIEQRLQGGEVSDTGVPRTAQDMQAESLLRMGQGLNAQQREDMLRGAVQAGFSASAVYAAQLQFQETQLQQQGRRTDDFDESMVAAQTSLQIFVREQMIQRINDLRNTERRSRLADPNDESMRQEKERSTASLARLMGRSEGGREEIKEVGQDTTDTTIARVWAEVEGQRALHTHRLGQVVPRHAA